MAKCKVCKKESLFISEYPGVCLDCVRKDFAKAKPFVMEVHNRIREDFNLTVSISQDIKAVACNLCVNKCKISEGRRGFCGLRENSAGKLIGADIQRGNLSFYFDDLPTNCVADWICPARGFGYPDFSYCKGPEYGYKNLAVFYNGCSFNCLFCQNWHFRDALMDIEHYSYITPQDLVNQIDENTACICYFGGDPSCQLPHSIITSRLALKNKKNKILRICWETNGTMDEKLLEEIIELALESGGCIKFDLKAWSEELNIALCGITNKRTLENFKKVATYINKRRKIPLLIASTLLIPGYIDEYEIDKISKFIASLDKDIPYSLLAFYPCFYMKDLPATSYKYAYKYRDIALKNGLRNVHIGNLHLLFDNYV